LPASDNDGYYGLSMTVVPISPPTIDLTGDRLVAAAAEVFAEKGYEGAGVAEIARRAGFTTGAIYSRYSGKAELLADVIRTCTQDEFDRLFADHAFDGRATDILAVVGSHLVTRQAEPGRALLLEAFAAARRDPEVARLLRQHLRERADRLAGLVEDAKAHGLVDSGLDTAAIVHFAHAVGLGFLLFEAVQADRPDPAGWEAVIQRVIASTVPPDVPTTTSTQGGH
jgi:AcrR family transcriptional regulator